MKFKLIRSMCVSVCKQKTFFLICFLFLFSPTESLLWNNTQLCGLVHKHHLNFTTLRGTYKLLHICTVASKKALSSVVDDGTCYFWCSSKYCKAATQHVWLFPIWYVYLCMFDVCFPPGVCGPQQKHNENDLLTASPTSYQQQ